MSHLDESDTPPGVGRNTPSDSSPVGSEVRVRELERENAQLREELAQARADATAYWQTLRTVAPEYAVTEGEMREVVENPVPLRAGLAEAERLLGADDGN